jgi:tetratricopeptide (TPR) repeat protein
MTTESSLPSQRRFAQDVLPWLIAVSAFAVYLFTLNSWLTLNSVHLTAKVAGWDWQPTVVQPALFLATLPFRCLPPSCVPLALNASTALCAALILALLARSVSLLPHDRFVEQERVANNEHSLLLLRGSWVPPLLAAVACGLQLTFWENAVSASGEMLDLLLFAYIIRCLLEHRLEKKQVWLDRAALVGGVAMANNWAMVCFLPLLVIAVLVKLFKFIRVRALKTPDFFSSVPTRLLLRLGFFGLAGFSLFLLLPAVQALSPESSLSLWEALRTQAASHKNGIQFVFDQFFRYHREAALVLVLISISPVLVMSVRWRTFSISDRTDFGLGALILLVSHAGLLVVCLWVAFDPFFSPRQIAHKLGFALPLLTLYYLAALSVGYYSGFFLLLFGASPSKQRLAPTGRFQPGLAQQRALQRIFQWLVPGCIYLFAAVAAAGLLFKNLPVIQAMNQPLLRQYGRLSAQSLPAEGATIFSGDQLQLLVLQATLASEAQPDRFIPVDARLLASPLYQKYLRRKFSHRSPETTAQISTALPSSTITNALETLAEQVQLETRLAQNDRLFYLQPAYGTLSELFYLEPHGLVYEMKRYPTNAFNTPQLVPAALTNNEAFWTRTIKTVAGPLQARIDAFEHPPSGLRKQLMDFAHLEMPAPFQHKVVAQWYAIALNTWGVTLQRNGRLREATRCFERAQNLNPRSLAASINLQCNSELLAGRKLTVAQSSALEEPTGRYRNVAQLVAEDGPVDDPSFCFQLGLTFANNRLFRQSSQQFDRLKTLVSGDSPARLKLDGWSELGEMRGKTLSLLAEIRADPKLQPLAPAAEKEMKLLQAEAWFEALRATHRKLRVNPDDTSALVNEGIILLQLGGYSNAIPPLTRVLALTNSPLALFKRAVAYLRLSNLDAAQTDYLKLLQAWPNDCRVYAGLGEIAYQRKDTKAAIGYYESYLAHADPQAEEAKFVAARLKALRQSPP